jgi:hypothetical protein
MRIIAIIGWSILPIKERYKIIDPIIAHRTPEIISRFSKKILVYRVICVLIGIN